MQEKANILLVDDQPANLLALEAILDGLGQNLVQARSGGDVTATPSGRRYSIIRLPGATPRALPLPRAFLRQVQT